MTPQQSSTTARMIVSKTFLTGVTHRDVMFLEWAFAIIAALMRGHA